MYKFDTSMYEFDKKDKLILDNKTLCSVNDRCRIGDEPYYGLIGYNYWIRFDRVRKIITNNCPKYLR